MHTGSMEPFSLRGCRYKRQVISDNLFSPEPKKVQEKLSGNGVQGNGIDEYLPCKWMVIINGDGVTVYRQHRCRNLLVLSVFFNGKGKNHAGFWFEFALENFSFDIMNKIAVMGAVGIFWLNMDCSGLTGVHAHKAGLDCFENSAGADA